MMYDRYVISELFPLSVLDIDTGDSYPVEDGIGFVEDMCDLLNQKEKKILHYENKIRELDDITTDLLCDIPVDEWREKDD